MRVNETLRVVAIDVLRWYSRVTIFALAWFGTAILYAFIVDPVSVERAARLFATVGMDPIYLVALAGTMVAWGVFAIDLYVDQGVGS